MATCALVEQLRQLPDPRRPTRNRLHPLENVLAIAFCGIVCGCEKFTEMEEFGHAKRAFFEKFLDLTAGVPSHDTFGRVFAALRPEGLMQCLAEWVTARQPAGPHAGETVAIDGKAMRGAGGSQATVHLVGAWATERGLALGQRMVSEKSNEIEAIPHLLALLELQGAVVTIDAAGCQKGIAGQIIERQADYVLALKQNHPLLYEHVVDLFLVATTSDDPALRRVRRVETSHGREETRDYYTLPVPADLHEREQWPGLRSLGMVIRHFREGPNGEVKGDVRYYLSSLTPGVNRFARHVRSHWGIENSLHWVLDVAFREDACQIENPTAAANLSAMNRLALSALTSDQRVKRGVATKRKVAGWNEDYLLEILDQCIQR
jgi:predicted transposase YbfD/YdcC